MNILRTLFGGKETPKAQAGGALTAALVAYPANTPPFLGLRRDLKPAELDANLAYILETRDQRLSVLQGLLMQFDIEIGPMLDADVDPLATATAIDGWLTQYADDLNQLPRAASGTCPVESFQTSQRAGPEIIYTLATDLALLEGEAIRRRDSRFDWAINREPKLRAQESAKRPCLMRAAQLDWATPLAFDLEMINLGLIHERRSDMGVLHYFGETLAAVMCRAYDPGN